MFEDFKNFDVKIYSNSSQCLEKVFLPKQTHSSNFIEIIDGSEDLSNCDALVTSNRDISLGIKTADCVPVCIGDKKKIGIIHIGWRGLCSGLYEKVSILFDEESDIYVGPFLHSFQIKKDFCYDAIMKKFGDRFFEISEDAILFDLEGAIKSILPKNAKFDERDTKKDLMLPSNRRNGTTERILTVISFK